jgi:replicative DNA helicase
MSTAELHRFPEGIRVPPHSAEAEQAVLGACLLDPAVIDDVRAIVTEADWYAGQNRVAWRAICAVADAGEPVDLLTVVQWCRDHGAEGRAIDAAYLSELLESVSGSSNATAYARVIREKSERREVIAAANRAADHAWNEPDGVSRALAEFSSVGGERQVGSVRTMREASRSWLDVLEQRTQGPTGLLTGFHWLDTRWQGLRPGNLVVVAGRPAMGKTTLGMALAENAAERADVLFFSLEMDASELLDRSMARYSRVSLRALRSGDLLAEDWPRLTAGMSRAPLDRLHIDDTGGLHIADLRARARARHRKSPLSLVVIDYLQLVRSDGENQNLRVAEITGQCKALAKELGCPVILLSQLNRGVEQRADKRPMPSDLRDSGAIEQDADIIAFCYRAEQYDQNTPRKGVMEVITSKHRMGEPGTDYLLADLAHSTLTTPPDDWQLPPERAHQPKRFDGKDL